MTWVVFVLYGLFAAAVRDRVVSRPNVMTWLRRAFAGGFALLGRQAGVGGSLEHEPKKWHRLLRTSTGLTRSC